MGCDSSLKPRGPVQCLNVPKTYGNDAEQEILLRKSQQAYIAALFLEIDE